jgi:predicted nucleotidyltransferase
MPSTLVKLCNKQLIKPGANCPSFLPEAVQYEVISGSFAYGVSSDTSDIDLLGWAIPDKDEVFPHLRGEIQGFGTQKSRFEHWQLHHIKDETAQGGNGRTYDCQYYSIVKYFDLLLHNNPNIIESLFVP